MNESTTETKSELASSFNGSQGRLKHIADGCHAIAIVLGIPANVLIYLCFFCEFLFIVFFLWMLNYVKLVCVILFMGFGFWRSYRTFQQVFFINLWLCFGSLDFWVYMTFLLTRFGLDFCPHLTLNFLYYSQRSWFGGLNVVRIASMLNVSFEQLFHSVVAQTNRLLITSNYQNLALRKPYV